MIFRVEEIAEATGGTVMLPGPAGPVGTDTRRIASGDWFLALVGDRFDAHDFLGIARDAGCAGVIAQRVPEAWARGWVKVDDTLQALQQLGRHVRNGFGGPVVGITGSAGKTTTRAMIGLLLEELGQVHQTEGNLNNHIGLPLTLIRAPVGAAAWVLEMGMNHAGEIAQLQDICSPNVRLITNVGPAHLEGLGTVENVAKAKGELFDGARPGDVLCLNQDDPLVRELPLPDGVRVVRYGSSQDCDISLTDAVVDAQSLHTRFRVQTPLGPVLGTLASPGVHLAHNAAAAIAVATALRVSPDRMAQRLAGYTPVGMRLRLEDGPRGTRVINDAYNANPMSTAASLRTLAGVSGVRKVALLGDMLELGAGEADAHREIIELALSLGIDLVGVAGEAMVAAAQGTACVAAADAAALGRQIGDHLEEGDLILLKGSRGVGMEQILQSLRESEAD